MDIASLQQNRKFGALLMNYSCTIECAHCCFHSAPGTRDTVMSVEDAVAFLGQLRRLDRLVHIAGGDPFRHYDRLLEILEAAQAQGVSPHFVETNASWATSDDKTRERFEALRRLGVLWMYISADVYHLQWVPAERIARALSIADEVFGAGTTMGAVDEVTLSERAAIAADEKRMAEFVSDHPPNLVGRAATKLADFFEPKPLDSFDLETGWGNDRGKTCHPIWDPIWEIHVDPYGNVQTNCGVILGSAHEKPVIEILAQWRDSNPILKRFSQRCVASLMDLATPMGFKPRDAYPQKCLLCQELRQFLRDNNPDCHRIFGPDEVYPQ